MTRTGRSLHLNPPSRRLHQPKPVLLHQHHSSVRPNKQTMNMPSWLACLRTGMMDRIPLGMWALYGAYPWLSILADYDLMSTQTGMDKQMLAVSPYKKRESRLIIRLRNSNNRAVNDRYSTSRRSSRTFPSYTSCFIFIAVTLWGRRVYSVYTLQCDLI